ncbi:MAG: methyl-accepting chemotaxis protein [Chthoniobacterales bacterium]|nr:methyl-accepting chemotaxis protein [Chthoniobacterales bacterium]
MKIPQLAKKLITIISFIGILPIIAFSIYIFKVAQDLDQISERSLESQATITMELVDRNLFERYGDVQAFASNPLVAQKLEKRSRNEFTQEDLEELTKLINKYVELYGIYFLSCVYDGEGNLVAVNNKTASGKEINTAYLLGRNDSKERWFQRVSQADFDSTNLLTGTVMEDVFRDEDVNRIYSGKFQVMGFSAQIKSADGKILGYWRNLANFQLVEDILAEMAERLASQGVEKSKFVFLKKDGTVIATLDKIDGGQEKSEATAGSNDQLFLNLINRKGTAGFGEYSDANQKRKYGFSVSDGALGYPGFGWIVLLESPAEVASKAAISTKFSSIILLICSAFLLIIASYLISLSIVKKILTISSHLGESSSQVAASSVEMSSSSQSLSEGASEQAASLEETGASLEQISSMTRQNAEHAMNAKELASQTREAAESGASNVELMNQAMSEIQTSSNNISKIIKTIDEIAFQTNILALNAAVEAARAGEAGAGFAVVADEVRALAQRAAQAAKETAERIEDNIRKSSAGVELSTKVNESFQQILSRVKQMDEIVAQIASASREQSQGIEQVNSAVTQLDKLTQQNAAAAEQTAGASQQLSSQAMTLKEIVAELEGFVLGRNRAAREQEGSGLAASGKQHSLLLATSN